MRTFDDPLLAPLVFAIRKSVEALETALAAPKIAPELAGLTFESETLSHAVAKLAGALRHVKTTETQAAAPASQPPRGRINVRETLRALRALKEGRVCPRCGGETATAMYGDFESLLRTGG